VEKVLASKGSRELVETNLQAWIIHRAESHGKNCKNMARPSMGTEKLPNKKGFIVEDGIMWCGKCHAPVRLYWPKSKVIRAIARTFGDYKGACCWVNGVEGEIALARKSKS